MDIDVVTPRGPRTAASHLENNLGANDAAASSSHDPPPSVTSSPAASPSPSHDSTGTSNNTNAAGTPANSQPAPTPPTTATPGGAIPPRRRVRPIRWSRPLIMLGASSVFITAMLYAHTPSFPVPLVRSAVAIDFGEYKPFDGSSKMPGALTHITALASDGDVASGIGQDGVVRLGFLLRHLNQDKIESWIKARRRANVDSVNSTTEQNQTDSDMEVANFEIYQDFVVPLEAAYNTKIWPSTSNYVGPPLQRVKASPVFFDRIFGTVEFLAIEKHGVLEGGYPRLALMYSTVQDEDVQYRSRVYTLGSTTSSQTSAPNCSTSFIFRWPPNPESCIGMEDSLSRYAREDIKMPGTLAFDDFGLSWTGNVYYSRISDRRAFRWVGNSSSDLLVQGPTQGETLTTSNPYSQLVLYELYNPLTNQSSATMLKIRSRERDHILDFEVVISYRPPNSTTWKRDIMYKNDEFGLLEQQIYFVKHPVIGSSGITALLLSLFTLLSIGTSPRAKTVAFVFADHIMSVEYVDGDDEDSVSDAPEEWTAQPTPQNDPLAVSQTPTFMGSILTVLGVAVKAILGPVLFPSPARIVNSSPTQAPQQPVQPLSNPASKYKPKEHGYVFTKRTIYEMDSSNLRIRSISMDATRKTLVLRNTGGDLIVFRRNNRPPISLAVPNQPHSTNSPVVQQNPKVIIYVWPIWPFMNLFLEGLAALLELLIMVFDSPANGGAGIDPAAAVAGIWDADHQLPPSALHLSSGSGATDTPVQLPFTEWKVQNIWPASRGFGFYVGERRSLAQVLVERSRIPPDILKAKDEEMGRTNSSDKPRNDPFVLMLYNDGLMLLFDLERHFEGSYAIGIIRSKWDMVLAMVSVASLFIINEIRRQR